MGALHVSREIRSPPITVTAKAVGRSTAWKCGLSDGHNGLADPLPRNIGTLNYYIIYCCTNYTWSVHVYVYTIYILICELHIYFSSLTIIIIVT